MSRQTPPSWAIRSRRPTIRNPTRAPRLRSRGDPPPRSDDRLRRGARSRPGLRPRRLRGLGLDRTRAARGVGRPRRWHGCMGGGRGRAHCGRDARLRAPRQPRARRRLRPPRADRPGCRRPPARSRGAACARARRGGAGGRGSLDRDSAPRRRSTCSGAARRPWVRARPHLLPHGRRPHRSDPGTGLARGPRAAAVRSRARRPEGARRRRGGVRARMGARAPRLRGMGEAHGRGGAVRSRAVPRRLGRRRGRRGLARLREADGRLGLDRNARGAPGLAPAGPRPRSPPRGLPPAGRRAARPSPPSGSTARTPPGRRACTSARGCGSSGGPTCGGRR